MRYATLCSGIEAPSVAWHGLKDWEPAWFSEIDKFPKAVLQHHYPDVPDYGDMTELLGRVESGEIEAPDLLCAGTPCQAFSVAGGRRSLADARGNLTLTYVEICDEIDRKRKMESRDPAIFVWENVPGVIHTSDNAFGCLLAAMAGESEPIVPGLRPRPGRDSEHWKWNKKANDHLASWPKSGCVYGPSRAVAWRILDAQYFGVAQRRRRVFLIASAREGFDPAKILFEFNGMRRDTPPCREQGKAATAVPGSGPGGSSRKQLAFQRSMLRHGRDIEELDIAPTVTADGNTGDNGLNVAEVVSALTGHVGVPDRGDKTDAEKLVVFMAQSGEEVQGDVANTVTTEQAKMTAGHCIATGYSISPGAGKDKDDIFVNEAEVSKTLDVTCSPEAHQGGTVVLKEEVVPIQNAGNVKDQGGMGVGDVDSPMFTLDTRDIHGVAIDPLPFNTTAITNPHNGNNPKPGDPMHTLSAQDHPPAIAVPLHDPSNTLDASYHKGAGERSGVERQVIAHNAHGLIVRRQVRRLIPKECERLQGFPDNYTNIPYGRPRFEDQICPDGARYKALGNSMAVPVVKWIGERIDLYLKGKLDDR